MHRDCQRKHSSSGESEATLDIQQPVRNAQVLISTHVLILNSQRSGWVITRALFQVKCYFVTVGVLWNLISLGHLCVNFSKYTLLQLVRNGGGYVPDSKVHGDNMGPNWGRQDPGGPHVAPLNLAIWYGARESEMIWCVLFKTTDDIVRTAV